MNLSALDVCLKNPHETRADAVWRTIELAPRLEAWGYKRLWLAEHHSPWVGHSCPETLVAVLAGLTDVMHIGTGCLLLRHNDPYRIAESFRVLSAIHSGRIDLGVGRGTADCGPVMYCDGRGYSDQIEVLLKLLTADRAVKELPELWLLGSSVESGSLAACFGASLAISMFLGDPDKNAIRLVISEYRKTFNASTHCPSPRVLLAVAGVCATTEGEAERYLSKKSPYFGITSSVVGNPDQCATKMKRMAEDVGADELMFLDLCSEQTEKLASYNLLATAFQQSGHM